MTRTAIFLGILIACTVPALAQPPGGGRGGPPGGFGGPVGNPPVGQNGQQGGMVGPQPTAVLAAIDADGDHTISAQEILNAAAALKKLDKNGDGQLSADEIHAQIRVGNQAQQPRNGARRRSPELATTGRPGQRPPQGGPPTAAGFMNHAATFDFNRDGVLNRAELEKMAVAFVAEMTRLGPPGGEPGSGGKQQQGGGRRTR